MSGVPLQVMDALRMEASINNIAGELDPSVKSSFDITRKLARALRALSASLAQFTTEREILKKQYEIDSLPPGAALPPAFRTAVEEIGAVTVVVALPDPIPEDVLFAALKTAPHPAVLVGAGAMVRWADEEPVATEKPPEKLPAATPAGA